MSRSLLYSVVLLALVLAASGAGTFASADVAAEPVPADVRIDNFTMEPQAITVKAGTSVRWTNADDIPHTVVSEDHTFKSLVMDTGDQFSHTFSDAGTYKYFCSIHPKMTGTIVVK